jgi:dTDP-4-dehydrorhamnose reductase
VAQISQDIGAKVIYISTDYVFGGGPAHRDTPYSEVDEAIPINNYGKTKLAGERMVATFCKNYLIIRASGFFGIAGKNSQKGNFVDKIITLSRERGEVKVVNDQIFSPTYTKHLANKIRDLIATDSNGIIHVTNKGECSWWKFAQTIVDLSGAKAVVVPIRSEDYPTRAKRPSYSVLAHLGLRILGLDDLKPWEEALKEYMFEQGYIG